MANIIISFIATILVGLPVGFTLMYLAECKEIREHKKEMQSEWEKYLNN